MSADVSQRRLRSPFSIPHSPLRRGFSLIELLVAVAVFATMAALAYGGLNALVRTRSALADAQDRFRDLTRSVALLERDLSQAVSRPVRDGSGKSLPALIGAPDRLELTRFGFANPQAEPRSNLQRVLYQLDVDELKRGTYGVLDRAPSTTPQTSVSGRGMRALHLRYLDAQHRWFDHWPAAGVADPLAELPRAVEFRFDTKDYGEIVRLVELTSSWPGSMLQ